MDALGYLSMIFVGVALGLLGGGGAILTVPILVYLFEETPVVATGYSLFVVGVSSLFGAFRYHRAHLVNYRVAVLFALPSFLGTLAVRRLVLPNLAETILEVGSFVLTKGELVMTAFAIVMIGTSLSMIRENNNPSAEFQTKPNSFLVAVLGFVVGAVAGFVGAGGGFLIVPALALFANIPITNAIGTSLLIIAANSMVGFLGDPHAAHTADWSLLLAITGVASVGIFMGTYAGKHVNPAKLKLMFGWFVLIMGSSVLLSQLLT